MSDLPKPDPRTAEVRGPDYYRMKSDQHYELAGLARHDGDTADELRHLKLAKEYDAMARE